MLRDGDVQRRRGRAELHRRSLLHDGGDVAARLRRRAHPHRAGTQARPRRTRTHVVERTQQLQVANSELRREVAERERGERLQAALYRIAALASLDERARFYRHVHAIVGELIDAKNFYIALLSDDGTPCRSRMRPTNSNATGARAPTAAA
jgi:hypothetical protein